MKIIVNGKAHEVADGLSVEGLLTHLGVTRVHRGGGEPRGHAQERLRGDTPPRGRQGRNRATDGWRCEL